MNIIEAIKVSKGNRTYPYITRAAWQHLVDRPSGAPKLLPTSSPDGMILFSEANGKKNPRRGWEPTAEDLLAEDWTPTR